MERSAMSPFDEARRAGLASDVRARAVATLDAARHGQIPICKARPPTPRRPQPRCMVVSGLAAVCARDRAAFGSGETRGKQPRPAARKGGASRRRPRPANQNKAHPRRARHRTTHSDNLTLYQRPTRSPITFNRLRTRRRATRHEMLPVTDVRLVRDIQPGRRREPSPRA